MTCIYNSKVFQNTNVISGQKFTGEGGGERETSKMGTQNKVL